MKRPILADSEGAPGFDATSADYGATPTVDKEGLKGLLQEKFRFCVLPRRYYVAVMAFLGFCNVYSMRVNLSIAILEMTKNQTVLVDGKVIFGEFASWTSFDQGVVLSAFFYGYIITQIPGGFLAGKIGGRIPFGVGIAGTALFTLLTPLLAKWGKEVVIAVRVIEGLLEGVTYPSVHALWSHWAPPQEKTKLATLAFAGSYFGTVIAMPLSAAIGEKFGWQFIFYFFGAVALLWCIAWFLTVAETPIQDKRITSSELQYIQTSIGFSFQQVVICTDSKRTSLLDSVINVVPVCQQNRRFASANVQPPWLKIASSMPVWAIVVAHFTENWGFYTMLTFLPRFIEDVTHIRLEKAGILAAIPYLVMGFIVLIGGQCADYLRQNRHIDTLLVRKGFNCVGFVAQAVFIWATAYSTTVPLTITFMALAIGIGGLAWSGFSVNHLDIAPQFAGLLMGISNTFATIPGMLSPVIAGAILHQHSVAEWQLVFHVVAGIYLFGAAFYAIFASASVQPWANLQGGYSAHLDELKEKHEGHDTTELD